ncbi:phospholipase D family protein [Sulfurovum sp. NBC37-1]|uniref:phospholipase D family protein n=1 Tax=Sulfurovum sp. (strain NBC37-1) TaxID=387093 RepID=UPI0001587A73|nr:phospholipase D family protein [Sulfurovum sp. NBC37-1]BAF73311.1 phospholipase D/transphosphatidylase [Sulfurovum sp. NBC37-1]
MRLSHVIPITVALFLAGCTPAPELYSRTSSHALKNYRSTDLGKRIEQEVSKHPGRSGFNMIPYGRDAFTARIAMTDLTDKTLDLQYYLWDQDETGRLLALHTLRVADRGVKVRVLLDDIGLQGRDDMIAAMDAHPNIEIRIFNPFSSRGMHLVDFMTDMERVNHRMHNKTVIMDNTFAIVGGRNIGNHYFGVSDDINFRDLDIATVGLVVRDVSKMYDYYWNGKWSVPISALVKKHYTMEDLEKERQRLETQVKKDRYPYPLSEDNKRLKHDMRKILQQAVWAKGKIIWNDPVQMQRDREKQINTMITKLQNRLEHLKKSFLIENPYFVPQENGVKRLAAMRERGVRIRILTNSLRANDVLATYAGYEKYRKELLQQGIEIYELRDDAGSSRIINHHAVKTDVRTGLHSKVMIFDEKDVFVGSFNLDPRSSVINTEGGLYVNSPALTKKIESYMNEGIDLRNAYRLGLDAKGHITWTTIENGRKVIYTSEPDVSAWDKVKVNLLQLLPLEGQL